MISRPASGASRPGDKIAVQMTGGGHPYRALLIGALLALFAVRGVLGSRADGTTADERLHLWYGERALREGTFLRVHEMLNSKMPVSALNALPPAIAARAGAAPLSWTGRLRLARLPTLLLGVLLGWLVFHWARALYGWRGGALALFLYTFCPNVIAHSHLVTTDVAISLGMFGATYAFWRYLERPGRGRLWAGAAAFGAAQLAKVTALFLVPSFALLLLLRTLRLRRGRRPAGPLPGPAPVREPAATIPGPAAPVPGPGVPLAGAPGPGAPGPEMPRPGAPRPGAPRLGALLLAYGAAAIVAINVGFWFEGTGTPLSRYALASPAWHALAAVPVLRAVPLPLPYAYLQGVDMTGRDAAAPAWTYLRGRYSRTGFWNYFLVALAVKLPLSTQLLLVLAVALLWSGRVPWREGEGFLLVPSLLLLAFCSLLLSLQLGLRTILPVLPFLFVFVSRAAAHGPAEPAPPPTAEGAPRPGVAPAAPALAAGSWFRAASRPGARWIAAAVGVLLLWNAVASFSIHPHYLAYFNELAGGPDGGARWLIDANLDWGQDAERVRDVYAAHSPVPVLIDPGGPVSGRIAVGLSHLVGLDPGEAARHAWLRDNFKPIASIGHSWQVFDVSEQALERCCSRLPLALGAADLDSDRALQGEPFGGGDGVTVVAADKLNDGMLGANRLADAARTEPPRPAPVRAWFGVAWRGATREVGRFVAYPGLVRGGPVKRFLALDYVFQAWDGSRWRDLPGTRVTGNRSLRIEHRVAPPIRAGAVRLLVERERNDRGEAGPDGTFRAACLELAVFPR